MQEEYHGIGTPRTYKLLYGWSSLTASVWLPSLCELVGVTGAQNTNVGTYFSAMQGINLSSVFWTDAQGGEQFAYFKQYNNVGGGQAIMNTCNQQQSWLRSSYALSAMYAWLISGLNRFNAYEAFPLTNPYAVHPAV